MFEFLGNMVNLKTLLLTTTIAAATLTGACSTVHYNIRPFDNSLPVCVNPKPERMEKIAKRGQWKQCRHYIDIEPDTKKIAYTWSQWNNHQAMIYIQCEEESSFFGGSLEPIEKGKPEDFIWDAIYNFYDFQKSVGASQSKLRVKYRITQEQVQADVNSAKNYIRQMYPNGTGNRICFPVPQRK